jgi:tetraacyldisaccharide 4'-kinase
MSTAPAPADDRARGLRAVWLSRGAAAWLLRPLSLLYGALVALRSAAYRLGFRRASHPGVPVIIIGNVVAGGAGKTPVTLAVLQHLCAQGWRPGVVSRGYGRQARGLRAVQATSTAGEVGDEPLLIHRRSGVPVVVSADRVAAARELRRLHPQVNVIVSDDGLQHLALARDVEVCVFDERGAGNGWLLPAGPLREPWPRRVDLLLTPEAVRPSLAAGCAPAGAVFTVTRRLAAHALRADGHRCALAAFRGQAVLAVAAIAQPEAFFAMLRGQGLKLKAVQALPDHYNFNSWTSPFDAGVPVFCTEKDALKLWAHHPAAWAVPLEVAIEPSFFTALDAELSRCAGQG